MTTSCLKSFGALVENNNYKEYRIASGVTYLPCTYLIEGDASGASYIWGLAAVTGGRARIYNIPHDSLQGDAKFFNILETMNCVVEKGSDEISDWVEVVGPKSLKACAVDMNSMPDTAQTLSCIASFAEGESSITGLETLKVKETDRLVALKTELGKLGIESEIGQDFIKVKGGEAKPASIETYHDHRMAMSFALFGSKIPEVEILDPQVVSKSFPNFWEVLQNAGITVQEV